MQCLFGQLAVKFNVAFVKNPVDAAILQMASGSFLVRYVLKVSMATLLSKHCFPRSQRSPGRSDWHS